ncbi:MAG: glycosyltransferase family 4 protein [Anaerovoracaceae bacterium]
MKRIKIMQQYMNAGDIGGLKTEYLALSKREELTEKYEFIPMILNDYHRKVNFKDIRFYYREIRKEKPDIIHIRGAGVESLNAVIAARLARSGKILVTVHGMFSDLVYYHPLKRWICKHIVEKLIFMLSDGISCVCNAATAREYFDRYRKKMLPYVYNRMPHFSSCGNKEKIELRERLGLPVYGKIGIYVGRVTKEKGLSFLIDALKKLDMQWPEDLYILIIGDGDYRKEMELECSKLKHCAHVIFLGKQSEIENYLHAGDFFIQPSLHENLSIAILEACAAKLPCLVTDVGGNAEIIENEKTGIIIPSGSSDSIANGLNRLSDDAVRKKLKDNIVAYDFSLFSDKNVDSQLDDVYMNLLNTDNKERKFEITKVGRI